VEFVADGQIGHLVWAVDNPIQDWAMR